MKKLSLVFLALLFVVSCAPKKDVVKEDVKDDSKPVVEDSKPVVFEKNPVATIEFENLGSMKFELFINDAPESVYNFISLANSNFYDGLKMHRILKDFMAQGGDPDGKGTGGPGYSIKGEFESNGVKNPNKHLLGSLSMARSQMPNSGGSQFFIMLDDVPSLDGEYAVFGKIIEGSELLSIINSDYAALQDPEPPLKELKILSISVDTFNQDIPLPKKY